MAGQHPIRLRIAEITRVLELYHNDMSTCAQKVRFALAVKGVEWQGVTLDLRAGDQHRADFLQLNPKGLVPVVLHEGAIISESNVILEYLNEAFPAPALLPATPLGRARVRAWLKRLDDGLHLEVAALSVGIAFRHQLLAVKNTPALLDAHFAAMPDPYMREVQREVVGRGLESPRIAQALAQFDQLFDDMDRALVAQPWLVGDALTLADIAYAPYITRLDHLQMQHLWQRRPRVGAWYERLRTTEGYEAGLTRWFNAKYLSLMAEAGHAARIALGVASTR